MFEGVRMLNEIVENRVIASLASLFARSPQQRNRLQETDAEIVQLPGGVTLAVTTDSIVEEIALGLYADPYLAGWMIVMANLSDMAAVGAKPIGLLISEIVPHSCTEAFLSRLQEGIRDACRACGTFVLGGDTNYGDSLILTGAAIGVCPDGKFLSRVGCKPGDLLFASGPLGRGNAFAIHALLHASAEIQDYRPRARLAESQVLLGLTTACMDTSDGPIAALDQLMRLNQAGFALNKNWNSCLDPWARRTANEAGIPEWLLLAGQHGEFELLFTVPPECEDALLSRAGGIHFSPIPLGRAVSEPGISLPLNGTTVLLDTARVRNCANRLHRNAELYLQELLSIDNDLREGALHHA
jgi:thiamine-monophosphate kinase